MKKPSSLAQQIQHAQREFNSWTPERQANVRLAGSSALSAREHINPAPQPQVTYPQKK